MRIGIDAGGTNTDAVLVDGLSVLAKVKTPTTEDVTGNHRFPVLGGNEFDVREKSPLDEAEIRGSQRRDGVTHGSGYRQCHPKCLDHVLGRD